MLNYTMQVPSGKSLKIQYKYNKYKDEADILFKWLNQRHLIIKHTVYIYTYKILAAHYSKVPIQAGLKKWIYCTSMQEFIAANTYK